MCHLVNLPHLSISLRHHHGLVIAGKSPVSGLVHISELSWDPVRNPRDLLEEGQTVRVKVIQLDK